MLHLVLLSLLVPLTASYCPFPGPVLPPPTHISTSKSFQSAIQNLTSYLSSPTTDLGFARNETTFSILLTDAEKPIWEYHHTTPASIVGNITVGRHSQYRVGSVSKVFADLLLLRLGLDLNTPVTKWLPGLREGLGGVDWDAITLKDLGSHMAGIRRDYGFWVENYTAAPLFQQVGLPPAIKEKYLPCEVEGLQDQPCTDAQVIKGMADSAPVFPPHAKPMYSNAGFNLLGFVVKKVTGMEYTRAVRRYITGPLGLEHTTFLPADHVVIPSTGLWHADLGQNNPAGGVYSTAHDLAVLARWILSPTDPNRKWLKPLTFGPSLTQAIGFPWEITRTTTLTSSVVEVYTKGGDLPGYGAILSLVSQYAFGVVVLTAGVPTGEAKYALADAVLSTVVPAFEDAAKLQAVEAGYTGRFSRGNGSWVEVGVDQGPGLIVKGWWVNGVDWLTPVREAGVEYGFYMAELSSVGKGGGVEEVWWAAPEVRTVSRQRGRGSVLREECYWTAAVTVGWYNGEPVDKVVVVKTAGKVVGVKFPVLGVTFMKECVWNSNY